MSKISIKKHWIIFRKLWTRIFIYYNRPTSEKKKETKKEFEQDLNKDRPYLIIEEDKENLLILTLTKHGEEKDKKSKENKPSFGRFGPIKCHCLDLDTYVILDTKIFATWKFIKESFFNIEIQNNKIAHQCLSIKQFFNLREALDIYWSEENEQLTIIELGMESEITKKRKIKRKSTPLFYPRSPVTTS